MPSSFSALKYRARGEANIGGIASILVFSTEDLTAEWPTKAVIASGKITTLPPFVTGKFPATLTGDIDSANIKHARKGALGYQNHSHEGGVKFAGISAEQITAAEATFNTGGIVIAIDMEGRRWVLGSRLRPLTFEYDTQTGAKADDAKQLDLKFKGDGYAWPILELTDTLVIPTA
ncbi:hypothetical protein [Siphonobacter sp. SORGH_AS_0500]|uniref:hypothetical protein n=1 Tax=Siphonobacter sp. SORGH_AS_0500 TaxID=1864824 RepID=UPI00285F0A75|nr:hypothetical protein [Siphonobacter sp. SORGH_AS_0500]MDR6194735.1 hypothetical protein [Siphonobacter sp. SORGH_AS_0500]